MFRNNRQNRVGSPPCHKQLSILPDESSLANNLYQNLKECTQYFKPKTGFRLDDVQHQHLGLQ